MPGEPAADRAPDLELVPHGDLVAEVGRDLAVGQPVDRELDLADVPGAEATE